MKIGFIKFGLKTYFDKTGTGQGSNHELVDVFKIMEHYGHECRMMSNSDRPSFKSDPVDMIFVFNGPLCPGYESKLNMFQGTVESLKFLKQYKIPWVYFWTDPRKDYDIRNHEIYKDHKPFDILSQEKTFYGHLDKLVMYGQKLQDAPKSVFIGALMNHTDPKRSKRLVDLMNHLDLWYDKEVCEIRGDWKKETNRWLRTPIPENEVLQYLAKVKYAINIGKNPLWVSQKFWEMILAKTFCFYENYDSDNLVLPYNDVRRFNNEHGLTQVIQMLEITPKAYEISIEEQTKWILPEYLNGDFIYDIIMKRIA